VISVGKDNDYGHPHKETMERLKDSGITVYRTDESGTIICTSDGNNISFNSNPASYNSPAGGSNNNNNNNSSSNNSEQTVIPNTQSSSSSGDQYVDSNGNGLIKGSKSKIYHIPGSTSYDKTTSIVQWFKTTQEAEAAGYRAPKN